MEGLNKLFAKIAKISGEIGAIQKDKDHPQNYKYHSADGIMGALNHLMAEHGLVVIPTAPEWQIAEVRYVIRYCFVLCDAETGAIFESLWLGEAPLAPYNKPDDKAMGKAHTYAYKYWLMKLFMISTVDTDDLDTNAAPKDEKPAQKQAPKQQDKPVAPQSKNHTDILDGAWNEDEMKKFWYYWAKTKQLADETILKGLGVSKLSEWTGSYEAAKTRMNEYYNSIK